jgi:hypothetical protein
VASAHDQSPTAGNVPWLVPIVPIVPKGQVDGTAPRGSKCPVAYTQDDLARATREVEEAEKRIIRQELVISELVLRGYPTAGGGSGTCQHARHAGTAARAQAGCRSGPTPVGLCQ